MSKTNTATTEVASLPTQRGLLATFGGRYNVEPAKVMHVLKQTCFRTEKPASDEQMMALLVVANEYKLNPFTKEIFAFEDKYKGIVPVVSVDGWARIINEHPQLAGFGFEYDEAGEWCECIIERKDRTRPIRVREYLAECRRGTGPWGSHPQRMLRHKTLIQCARLAFGFAGIYDQDEAERIRDAIDITPEKPAGKPRTEAPRAKPVMIEAQPEPATATDATPVQSLADADAEPPYEDEAGTRG
jgi:phage recombination protein Bet